MKYKLIAIKLSVLAIAGASVIIMGCPPASEDSATAEIPVAPEDQTVAVEALIVSSAQFFDAVTVSGTVRGTQEVNIVAETSGIIKRTLVELGDSVTANQVLIQLDNEVERYALAQAKDQLKVAELELRAVQELIANNNSSAAELARAQAAASGARSALANAQKQFDNKVIKTPIGGTIAVLPSSVSVGNYIQPGTVITRVVNLNRLRLDAGLGERDILLVDTGANADVELAACGSLPQPARVRNIASGSNSNDGNFLVIVEWDNRCGTSVKSGMAATVRIAPSNNQDNQALVVPTVAILNEGSQTHLYIVEKIADIDVAKKIEVEIGKQLGNRTEIVSGVNEGDLLIVAPVQSLSDGVPVEATSIGSTATIR